MLKLFSCHQRWRVILLFMGAKYLQKLKNPKSDKNATLYSLKLTLGPYFVNSLFERKLLII